MTATADVIALPVAETTVAEVLERMAERGAPLFEVRPWAHSSLSEEELALAWEDFREAVRVREGLATGCITWAEVQPELTCTDRQETAFQDACAEADEARERLQHGYRGVPR